MYHKKLYIRFETENFVYNKMGKTIRSFIEDKFIIKEAKYRSTELEDFFPEKGIYSTKERVIEKPIKKI